MKKIAAIALVVAATFIAAGSAPAQDHKVKATIPFAFTVGDQHLPSGNYTIGSNSRSADVVALSNWDKKVNVMSLGLEDLSKLEHENILVFHQYGNQYFLSEIRSEGAAIDLHFPMSKAEKRAKTQVEEAGLFVNDPVLVALN